MAIILSYWWVLALISGLGLATRNIMFKIGSGHMDAAMGALILSTAMAVVSIGYFIWSRLSAGEQILSGTINTWGVICANL